MRKHHFMASNILLATLWMFTTLFGCKQVFGKDVPSSSASLAPKAGFWRASIIESRDEQFSYTISVDEKTTEGSTLNFPKVAPNTKSVNYRKEFYIPKGETITINYETYSDYATLCIKNANSPTIIRDNNTTYVTKSFDYKPVSDIVIYCDKYNSSLTGKEVIRYTDGDKEIVPESKYDFNRAEFFAFNSSYVADPTPYSFNGTMNDLEYISLEYPTKKDYKDSIIKAGGKTYVVTNAFFFDVNCTQDYSPSPINTVSVYQKVNRVYEVTVKLGSEDGEVTPVSLQTSFERQTASIGAEWPDVFYNKGTRCYNENQRVVYPLKYFVDVYGNIVKKDNTPSFKYIKATDGKLYSSVNDDFLFENPTIHEPLYADAYDLSKITQNMTLYIFVSKPVYKVTSHFIDAKTKAEIIPVAFAKGDLTNPKYYNQGEVIDDSQWYDSKNRVLNFPYVVYSLDRHYTDFDFLDDVSFIKARDGKMYGIKNTPYLDTSLTTEFNDIVDTTITENIGAYWEVQKVLTLDVKFTDGEKELKAKDDSKIINGRVKGYYAPSIDSTPAEFTMPKSLIGYKFTLDNTTEFTLGEKHYKVIATDKVYKDAACQNAIDLEAPNEADITDGMTVYMKAEEYFAVSVKILAGEGTFSHKQLDTVDLEWTESDRSIPATYFGTTPASDSSKTFTSYSSKTYALTNSFYTDSDLTKEFQKDTDPIPASNTIYLKAVRKMSLNINYAEGIDGVSLNSTLTPLNNSYTVYGDSLSEKLKSIKSTLQTAITNKTVYANSSNTKNYQVAEDLLYNNSYSASEVSVNSVLNYNSNTYLVYVRLNKEKVLNVAFTDGNSTVSDLKLNGENLPEEYTKVSYYGKAAEAVAAIKSTLSTAISKKVILKDNSASYKIKEAKLYSDKYTSNEVTASTNIYDDYTVYVPLEKEKTMQVCFTDGSSKIDNLTNSDGSSIEDSKLNYTFFGNTAPLDMIKANFAVNAAFKDLSANYKILDNKLYTNANISSASEFTSSTTLSNNNTVYIKLEKEKFIAFKFTDGSTTITLTKLVTPKGDVDFPDEYKKFGYFGEMTATKLSGITSTLTELKNANTKAKDATNTYKLADAKLYKEVGATNEVSSTDVTGETYNAYIKLAVAP